MGLWAGGRGDRLGGKEHDERQLNLPQDWAPAHSTKKMLQCCETTLQGFWGEAVLTFKFPDLNPLDFAV